jgi:hypothetical protein
MHNLLSICKNLIVLVSFSLTNIHQKNKFDEYCCCPNINSQLTSDNNKGN